MLRSWLRGCWAAVGRGCCLPGDRETVSDGGETKELRTSRCRRNQAEGFQRLNNVWSTALFILRWKGELLFSYLLVLISVGTLGQS